MHLREAAPLVQAAQAQARVSDAEQVPRTRVRRDETLGALGLLTARFQLLLFQTLSIKNLNLKEEKGRAHRASRGNMFLTVAALHGLWTRAMAAMLSGQDPGAAAAAVPAPPLWPQDHRSIVTPASLPRRRHSRSGLCRQAPAEASDGRHFENLLAANLTFHRRGH